MIAQPPERPTRGPVVLAVIAAALALVLPASASAAYEELFSMSAMCDEIVYPGEGDGVTFTLDTDYECGQFANGDWYVVTPTPTGDVTVNGISPAMTTGRHGVVVNPSQTGNTQSWDNRQNVYAAPTISFPYAAGAGESIVKYVSASPGEGSCSGLPSGSCGQFAAVLTVLAEVPASPETTFRPPYFGTHKPLLSTTDLRTEYLLSLSSDCCAAKITRTEALSRTSHLRLEHGPSSTAELEPVDAFEGGDIWGGDVLKNDTEVVNWLMLDEPCDTPPCMGDELELKMPVLVGYVQYGIDLWGATRAGVSVLRGGGGNGTGKLFVQAFATALLDDEDMKDDLDNTDINDFWETNSFALGVNGDPLWGQLPVHVTTFEEQEEDYWDELGQANAGTMRDPYLLIDGGGTPGMSYQRSTMMPTKYAAHLIRIIPGLQDVWPDGVGANNGALLMEYADRVVRHGALTQPDTCAPKSGTYEVDYGPDGLGSCIDDVSGPPFGRRPDKDGNTKNGLDASRHSAFNNQMWDAHRYVRPLAPASGTVIDVDEPFGVQPYGEGHVRIEFATDTAFTSIVCTTGWFEDGPGSIDWTYPGPIGTSGVSCPLDPGTYYWRAEWGWDGVSPAPDTPPKRSEVRSFSVNTECDSDDASGCVPGAVLELNETQFVCDEPLEDIAEDQDGVLPLLVRVTFDEPVELSSVVDLKTGCDGDGNTAVTLSNDCTTTSSTCYSGTGYVPGEVDLILDIRGNGATYGGRDTAVKARQAARDIVITGQVDCGPRGPGANQIYARTTGANDDNRQDAVLVQGGERLTFVDVKSGSWGTQTSTCMAANGGFDVDEASASFPVEDVVCIGCEMVTCSRGLVVDDTLRSGAINSFFRTGDPQWKLVDLPATGSDNGVDAGQCWSDTAASFFGGSAVNPINVGNFYDRWPYSGGGD